MRRLLVIAGCLLLLAGTPAHPSDEPLGRLFFTPQQRDALDAGRRIAAAKPKAEVRPTPRRTRAVRLDGIVTRSDGERTVWVNGRPLHSGQPSGLRVTNVEPTAARIQVGESGETVKLRVGQTHGRSGAASRAVQSSDRPRRTANRVSGAAAASAVSGTAEQDRPGEAPRAGTENALTADDDEKD
ncbi:MAG: hypothetical protein ACREU7_12485 [Burkholderiales bacterium]